MRDDYDFDFDDSWLGNGLSHWGQIESAEDLIAAALLTLLLLPLANVHRAWRAGRPVPAVPPWSAMVWAAIRVLYAAPHGRGLQSTFKMGMFCMVHARVAYHWLGYLQRPALRALVQSQPRLLDKLQRPYLNRHWRPAQRLRALVAHYEWMLSHLQLQAVMDLYEGHPMLLARLTGRGGVPAGSLWLEHAAHQEREGELALTLRGPHADDAGGDPDIIQRGMLMATLAFSIAEDAHGAAYLAIGCVQGGQLSGPTHFRDITKAMHGLRPKALLVSAAQVCARHWGLTVRGIAPQAHPFTSLRYRVSRRKRAAMRHIGQSYQPLWQESGGVAGPKGWYLLPDEPRIRSRDEVASDKRSLYERRAKLQLDMAAQMGGALGQLGYGQVDARRASAARPASAAAAARY